MKAGQLVGAGRMEMVEVPAPRPSEGTVLVRSHRASICGSDLHIVYDGYYQGEYPGPPGFPGHEGVGRVEEPSADGFSPGDLVLAVPHPPVARCLAELQVVPSGSLIKLRPGADLDGLLMAQQLGTVVYAFARHWPASLPAEGKTAAICGAGSAGLFFCSLARLAGFETVIVADRSSSRLAAAGEHGADVTVEVPDQSFVETVLEATNGEGADLVIEAVGFDETRIQCLEAVRYQGRVGYFGFPESRAREGSWSFSEAWRKIPTIEVVNGAQGEEGLRSFRKAIDLIESGRVPVASLLKTVYPLDQIQEAFDAARAAAGTKVTVELGS